MIEAPAPKGKRSCLRLLESACEVLPVCRPANHPEPIGQSLLDSRGQYGIDVWRIFPSNCSRSMRPERSCELPKLDEMIISN
jgi:hypothetical protein